MSLLPNGYSFEKLSFELTKDSLNKTIQYGNCLIDYSSLFSKIDALIIEDMTDEMLENFKLLILAEQAKRFIQPK